LLKYRPYSEPNKNHDGAPQDNSHQQLDLLSVFQKMSSLLRVKVANLEKYHRLNKAGYNQYEIVEAFIIEINTIAE